MCMRSLGHIAPNRGASSVTIVIVVGSYFYCTGDIYCDSSQWNQQHRHLLGSTARDIVVHHPQNALKRTNTKKWLCCLYRSLVDIQQVCQLDRDEPTQDYIRPPQVALLFLLLHSQFMRIPVSKQTKALHFETLLADSKLFRLIHKQTIYHLVWKL